MTLNGQNVTLAEINKKAVLSQEETRDAAEISIRIEFYNKSITERLCRPYAKHGNLVDADASGAKASTKHLESRLEVIQGHALRDH